MNSVSLYGRLGRDPETRQAGGADVCEFSLATGSGDRTQWHRVVCFGKSAEIAAKYLRKGGSAGVVGELRYRKWEDKDGNKRETTEIVAREVHLGERPASNGDRQPQRKGGDDIPF